MSGKFLKVWNPFWRMRHRAPAADCTRAFSGRWVGLFWIGLFGSAALFAAEPGQPVTAPADGAAAPSDLLQFLDGGLLHGELRTMDSATGVRWAHPAARQPITFRPSNIASIRFEKAQRVETAKKPTCWLQFANGDEVFGILKAMNAETLELETWFGGQLRAPRAALNSATFNWNGFSILYEGPSGPDGWKFDQGPRGWKYQDGGFVAKSVGILGRDLHLKGSASLSFDLAWNGHFSLSIILYSDAIDRYDYSQNSYMVHLAPGYVNLQRVQAGSGVTTLGPQAQIAEMVRKNQIRFDIRSNKEDATFAILADGQLVHQWRDHSGFVARGSGVVFSAQMDGPTVRLSNIKVTEWDGVLEPQISTNAPPDQDLIHLANRDRVLGKIDAIDQGKVKVTIPQTTIDIPLARVTHFALAQPHETPSDSHPWEIRAEVSGGGTVAFRLEEWGEEKVSGQSSNFGRLALNPKSIRQIQFNARQQASPSLDSAIDQDEFEQLDK